MLIIGCGYMGCLVGAEYLSRGETVTGGTTMLMNERMDEGDVLLQQEIEIAPGEHALLLNQHHIVTDGWSTVTEGVSRRIWAPRRRVALALI